MATARTTITLLRTLVQRLNDASGRIEGNAHYIVTRAYGYGYNLRETGGPFLGTSESDVFFSGTAREMECFLRGALFGRVAHLLPGNRFGEGSK